MVTIDFLKGPFPTAQEYRVALEKIQTCMAPKQMQLLINHYKAPNHTITADELAKSVGYKNSNLQYGLLAGLLSKALGKVVNSDQVYILLTTDAPKIKGVHRLLTMRPQVVLAIKDLNWA